MTYENAGNMDIDYDNQGNIKQLYWGGLAGHCHGCHSRLNRNGKCPNRCA